MNAERRFNRHQSLGYLVNQLARLFAQQLERRLVTYSVPLGQFPLLLVLWEEDGLTQSEIARRLSFEQPTVANTLKRMKRDKLVTTQPDPTNRKKVLVFLTEKGHRLHDPLTAEARAVNAKAIAALLPEEASGFHQTVARLTDALR